jgi:hypothetical protein
MDYRSSYTFRVTGHAFHYVQTPLGASGMTDDGCGTTSVTITPPRPATPTISLVNVQGPGSVRIEWGWTGQNENGYLILGPGLPAEGREKPANTASFNQVIIEGIPSGNHTWLITPFWDTPDGRVVDVSTGARATATIP